MLNLPDRSILFTDGERDYTSGYTLRNPVKSDGTYRKYARIAIVIARNGPISKRDVLKKIGHDIVARYPLNFQVECPGRLCGTFATLHKANIISYDAKTRKWSEGMYYYRFIQIILNKHSEFFHAKVS